MADIFITLKWHSCMFRDTFRDPTHVHWGWALFAVEKGSFSYETDGASETVAKGDLVLFRPDCRIKRQVLEPLYFHFIMFEWRDALFPMQHPLLKGANALKLTVADQARLKSTLEHIRRLTNRDYEFDAKKLEHFINDLCVMGFLELEQKEKARRRTPDALMEKARLMLTDGAFQGIEVRDVAASLNLSPLQLTRRFKAVYDLNPSDYVTNLRIGEARRLLEESEYTLEHIAELSGYSSCYYLSRMFRKKMDVTPSEYRKIHRI